MTGREIAPILRAWPVKSSLQTTTIQQLPHLPHTQAYTPLNRPQWDTQVISNLDVCKVVEISQFNDLPLLHWQLGQGAVQKRVSLPMPSCFPQLRLLRGEILLISFLYRGILVITR